MNIFITVISQLIKLLLSSKIKFFDKLIFIIIYPLQTLINILKGDNEKKSQFIDGRPFYFLGRHYNLVLNHVSNHLNYYSNYYKNASVVIDIGASFGSFPRMVKYIYPNSKVYAIEMMEESYEILRKNCEFLQKVDLSLLAIGNKNKKIQYSFDPDYPEGGNIGLVSYKKKGVVEQVTLDQFILDKKIKKISLLKIDAEGYELTVLESANKALKITDIVIVETQFDSKSLISILNIMNKFGFFLSKFGAVNINHKNDSIGSADLVFKKGKHKII